MHAAELRDDLEGELEQMRLVVHELQSLRDDVAGRSPTLREKTAGAGFLAQFYNGVENILKRIARYEGAALPTGERWHVELFERFCRSAAPDGEEAHAAEEQAPQSSLPVFFEGDLAEEMARYRGFRHVMRSSYGIELNWTLMAQGIDRVGETFEHFAAVVRRYLANLPEN